MVDFHGELVLLLHWSLVNYAAVAKILKKHDKLTGSRLRAPVLASVLHQVWVGRCVAPPGRQADQCSLAGGLGGRLATTLVAVGAFCARGAACPVAATPTPPGAHIHAQ